MSYGTEKLSFSRGGAGVELLAPAGDELSLRAAVVTGADAVYLGASAFSARAKAANFAGEELRKAVEYCHLFGVKVYLAVNTVIKKEEYPEAERLICEAVSYGVDAFIMQDIPFIVHLHSTMSDITVHLSTQAGVHNAEGAIVARSLGAKRVILSRETTLEDIRRIRDAADIEIEYFVHGALCVAFSGNCYFSSMAAGLSGNRGRCLQLCRKPYIVNGKEGYFLSAKDLDLSGRLNELIDAGVTSLKIEGRMKRYEYVGEAVAYYRALLSGERADKDGLLRLFNRGGGCEGYLTRPTAPVIFPAHPAHIGVRIGKVERVVGKKATLALKKPLHRGDGLKFVRSGAEVGGASVTRDGTEVGFGGDVRAGDEVRITTDSELTERINARTRKLTADLVVSASVGKKMTVSARCAGAELTLESGFVVESAERAPVSERDVIDCFGKVGGTEFAVGKIEVSLSCGAFIPKSLLNEFRRDFYERLREAVILNYNEGVVRRTASFDFTERYACADFGLPADVVQTDDLAAAERCLSLFDTVAIFPARYDAGTLDGALALKRPGKKVLLSLPVMLRGADLDVARAAVGREFDGFVVNNIGELELCRGKNVLLGPFMNILDPFVPAAKVMSPEFDGADCGNGYIYAFGKLPIMTFAHCPIMTVSGGKCRGCGDSRPKMKLAEPNGTEFDLRFYKVAHCYAQLLNCVPCDVTQWAAERGRRRFIDLVGYDAAESVAVAKAVAGGRSTGLTRVTRGYTAKKLV